MSVAIKIFNKMKRRIVVVLGCAILLSIVILSNNDIFDRITPFLLNLSNEDISCYNQVSTHQSIPTLSSKSSEKYITSEKNIFFHETSCFGDDGIILTPRQACAVESAAKMNPGFNIYLLLLSPLNYSSSGNTELLVSQFKNTPLEEWWNSGMLKTSRWPRSHMSDILRYLTLWKFRGIYLDLDVVITSSLEHLTNFAGAEDWEDVAAGVMGFSSDSLGQRVADACLRDLQKNFRGDVWGNNGPGVITRTLQKLCATKYAKDMTIQRCHGFKVFSPSAFYPIHYKTWKQYFNSENANETIKTLNKSLAIHVWNKLSQYEIIKVGSQVPYAAIANEYCPKVYNNCGKTF